MTPEKIEEAKRLADALTIPLNGKYVSTDDIKKGGEMIKQLMESKDRRPWFNAGAKSLLGGVILCLVVGFVAGKVYTWDSIIVDCKVLGAFRIANTAFHCKMLTP